jgi:hypothetical protein
MSRRRTVESVGCDRETRFLEETRFPQIFQAARGVWIMPIRFRCAYCNQLMGIARRKAGTVVRCPKCAGQVVVPNPAGGANGAGHVFEQSDFERFFQEEGRAGAPPAAPQPAPAHGGVNLPLPAPISASDAGFDVEPVPHFDQPYALGPGVFLSPGKLAIVSAVVVLLMGLAFFAGLLVGRS